MGWTDDVSEYQQEIKEALDLLVEVAEGKKSQQEVRDWLEKKYPDRCVEVTVKNKWQRRLPNL